MGAASKANQTRSLTGSGVFRFRVDDVMFYYRDIGDMWSIFNEFGKCVFESDNRSAMFLHAGFNGLEITRPH